MSGHSKWAQIKRQKGIADIKKGAAFTRLANTITIAVREGGKDPTLNFRLRLAVDKARAANMPKDNIERAIARGAGELSGAQIQAVTYEGYGSEGAAIVAEALTDNRNRTAAELRSVFSKHGGNLAGANSVLWMFERRGVLEVFPNNDRSKFELAAIDAGALDIEDANDVILVYTEPSALNPVRDALVNVGATVQSAETALVSKTTVTPTPEGRRAIKNLLLALEDLPEITHVATNAEL